MWTELYWSKTDVKEELGQQCTIIVILGLFGNTID